jgi:hypothetical protein
MSPDASVHEDQMEHIQEQREIRKRGRRRARRSRNKGCFKAIGCMLPIFAIVALIGYLLLFFDFNVDNYYRPEVGDEGQEAGTQTSEDGGEGSVNEVQSIAADIKKRLIMLKQPGGLEMRLNELRGKVLNDSEASSMTLKSQLDKATKQLETIREKVREKGEKGPETIEQIKTLTDKISTIEGALSDGDATSKTKGLDDLKDGE